MNHPESKSTLREYAEALLFAIIAAFILRTFVVQAFKIPTGSMKDTLLVGDFLLVNKFIYGARTPDFIPFTHVALPTYRFPAFKAPKPGEIIVFKYPRDETQNYIKRCIAEAGQTLEVKDGWVYVDGEPEGATEYVGRKFDASRGTYFSYYLVTRKDGKKYTIRHFSRHNTHDRTHNYGPVTVPEGHLFMMGDNRDDSSDSRAWGFLPKKNLVGEAMIIYWSMDTEVPFYNIFKKVRWSRLADIIR